MRIVERYFFVRIGTAATGIFLALGVMVWLSQALRHFDLVTANGQSLAVFLQVSLLLVPALFVIVLPVAVMIAVIYTFTSLNSDSELIVINASGASQLTVLRPVLAIGLICSVLVGAMTLYFTPLSLRVWQDLITNVRGNILTTVLRPGGFMPFAPDLSFHMKERNPDGSLGGIFLSDTRDPETAMTYIARRGAILENPLGTFLIMTDGVIQQRNAVEGTLSMIEFSSYAFDLTSFTSTSTEERTTSAAERPTSYLLNPDPEDRYRRQYPGKFGVELHKRLAAPLFAFVYAVVPLVFLGQAESARQGRAASAAGAVTMTIALQALNVFLPGMAESSNVALIGMYGLPITTVAISALLVLVGVQLRPPEAIVAFVEGIFARFGGGARARPQAAHG